MGNQQAGALVAADQAGASQAPNQQMAASQPSQPKPSGFAAFGTSGGAALVFRDLASI